MSDGTSDGTTRIDTGGHESRTPWDDPDWRWKALAWIQASLAAAGSPISPADLAQAVVRLRPWSVVVRVEVPKRGRVWFKANPPSSAFEPALIGELCRWAPGQTLTPIAIDTERAWSLLPDGGALLAQPKTEDWPGSYWETPLREYARLQRAVLPHVGELLAIGLPDLRPAVLSSAFDALMDQVTGHDGMAAVAALRPQIADWATELAASRIPPTLDHSDLHEHQIFTDQAGRYTFFDWGDASVAHPFTSLLVTLRVVRERFGTQSASSIDRLRDTYLDRWTDFGVDISDLRREASLACRLGPIGRALTWSRIFAADGARPHENVVGWLRQLHEPQPL